ncbi:MAG: nitrogenase iron protein NifH [Lachnospiraceae bacterium]|nr:nitrogenase iron protein NifH [Lachnospiraceae bacterium]
MGKDTVRIAFYGKGGIGKSTIAANVSAVLAASGRRVLHIGCDPKSDSTRCLMKRRIPTVLDQLNQLDRPLVREDIVWEGIYGVNCIEAGGPQAGSGCAGMGITTMDAELKRLGIPEENWDVILYDVLGDVVCGGFAMPMRRHYVEKIFVITSSDYLSIYAANNILKGIRSYSRGRKGMFGGLILNHARSSTDGRILEEYSGKTGAGILFQVPESEEIRRADFQKCVVQEVYEDGTAAKEFQALAEKILNGSFEEIPHPLDEDAMDRFGESVMQYLAF